jgi:hypothetical protein
VFTGSIDGAVKGDDQTDHPLLRYYTREKVEIALWMFQQHDYSASFESDYLIPEFAVDDVQ